ncbi:MAG: hypothetical protein WB341_17490, partial [Terracidiphilus sp.]
TVAELIRYRLRHERYIVRAGETRIQTRYGEFRMIAYESQVQGGESHIALIRGDLCPDCPAFHAGPAAGPFPDALASGPAPAPVSNGLLDAADPGPHDANSPQSGVPQVPVLGPGIPHSPNLAPTPLDLRPPCPHPVLVRVHTRCTPGDVFAADCHCREILDQSMRMIAEEGCGVILYLHNTSRGFAIDHTPPDTFSAAFGPEGAAAPAGATPLDTGRLILHQELRAREGSQARSGRILRAIGLGGQILSDLGIQRIRLLSNTPMHIPALEGFGLEIVEQVPIPVEECTRVV